MPRFPGSIAVIALAAAVFVPVAATAGSGSGGSELYLPSARLNGDHTVTLPLYHGRAGERDVWFVVLDASDGHAAQDWGVNESQKLRNARHTGAVQKAMMRNGMLHFEATVDFAPQRVVMPGPNGFPPAAAEPGAVAEMGYSPLVELPDGTILNAPHVSNATGDADKVVSIDRMGGWVTYGLTEGRQNGRIVQYVSTDASNPVAAALEGVTYAPALDAAPSVGGDGTNSARASLGAFVNGQTGAGNANRQGLNSALLDGLEPLNILSWNPKQGRYSPLWDVHLAAWTDKAIRTGKNTRQAKFFQLFNLADKGLVTGPDGGPFGASGFIVNCPLVSAEGDESSKATAAAETWSTVKDLYRR